MLSNDFPSSTVSSSISLPQGFKSAMSFFLEVIIFLIIKVIGIIKEFGRHVEKEGL